MIKRFKKEYTDDKITFIDRKDNKVIAIKHYDNPNCFDILRINEDLDNEFVNYIIEELQSTNDIAACEVLYNDKNIEDIFHNNGFKVLNYNYLIPYKEYNLSKNLISDNDFDDESKKYYLDMLNKLLNENTKYYCPNREYFVIDEKYFENTEFEYMVYRINNKIVGVVDFSNFDYAKENIDELYNYSNKLAIRNLFADTIEISVQILKDLLNKYEKDIIISHLYKEDNLKEVIKNVNGEFKYTMYTSVKLIIE